MLSAPGDSGPTRVWWLGGHGQQRRPGAFERVPHARATQACTGNGRGGQADRTWQWPGGELEADSGATVGGDNAARPPSWAPICAGMDLRDMPGGRLGRWPDPITGLA